MKISRENMSWVLLEIKENNSMSPPQQPPFPLSPQTLQSNSSFDLNSKVSPSILLIIIILSIIFFISGLLHLFVRFLLTPPNRDQDDFDNVTALQGQLQQLFHLHDSGVDQSFIDTLPVFPYKSIIGLKNPFDCAVCLCEFEPEDKLRLLPKCSHAFHMDCIDTWLLSHSTCPLCRSSLLSDFSTQNCSPFVLVLESGSDSSREIVIDRNSDVASNNNANMRRSSSLLRANSNSHLGFDGNNDFGSTHFDLVHKLSGISGKDAFDAVPDSKLADSGEKVVPIKLGKFRNVDGGEGSSHNNVSNNSNVDERRCFSMGSYEYIMDEESILKVHVSMKKQPSKKPLLSGHRPAMSEIGGYSMRDFRFNGVESIRIPEEANGNSIGKNNKKESFSISKIWLRGKKEKQNNSVEGCSSISSSRRAFSFRFPVQKNAVSVDSSDDSKGKIESGCDEESPKGENSESLETKTPSFARRTMLWLVGRQNKVVHSSFTSNV